MVLKDAFVFTDGAFKKTDILIKSNIISELGDFSALPGTSLENRYIAPGFIDMGCRGALGADFLTADSIKIKEISAFNLKNGVTSIVPYISAESKEELESAVKAVGDAAYQKDTDGNLIGLYLDNPFKFYDDIDSAYLALCDISKSSVAAVSLNSDIQFSAQFTATHSVSSAITVSGGKRQNAEKMFQSGAGLDFSYENICCSPASPPLESVASESGTYALTTSSLTDSAYLKSMYALFRDKTVLISASSGMCGMPDGEYVFKNKGVMVRSMRAFDLTKKEIFGTKTLFDCFKDALKIGIKPEQAILSVTEAPAKALHIFDKIGSIAPSKQADLLVLDKDFNIVSRIYKGKFCL